MAMTLTESAKLSQDKLIRGIIEELIYEIPLFRKLPFKTVTGNAYAYNREDTSNMGSVNFHQVGDLWTESTAKFTQHTANLYALGADADVDNLIQKTRSNINDQMAAQVKIKTKLMGHEFEEQAIYGVAASSNGFDGLHTIIASSGSTQKLTTAASATPAALSMSLVDEAIDNCKAGRPDAIITTKRVRRNITKYLRTVGSYTTDRDEYGNLWEYWADVPIIVCEKMTDTELCDSNGQYLAKTGGTSSSLFVVKFGEGNGLIGLQNGSIETETWAKLEQKDASRTRIKWYVGMALMSTLALVRICNIKNDTATA